MLTRRSATDSDAPPVVLLDPAVGTADAANAVDWFTASPDGSLVAVGTSEGGSEDSVLRVLDATDGADRGEAIPDTRACSVAWEPDGSGFAYTRYPPDDQYHRTVHHHVLGTPWVDDPVVWAEHPDPQAWPDVTMSPDGAWLLVHVLVGWARIDVHVLERATGRWTTAIAGEEVTTGLRFAADGTSLVGVTTLAAPKGRVVRVPLDDPAVERLDDDRRRGRRRARLGRRPRRRPVDHRDASCRRHGLAPHAGWDAARCRHRSRRRRRRRRAQRRPRHRRRVRRRRRLRRTDRAVEGRQRRGHRRGLDDTRAGRRRRPDDDRPPGRVPVARRHVDRACS